jgi:hypothetical protein
VCGKGYRDLVHTESLVVLFDSEVLHQFLNKAIAHYNLHYKGTPPRPHALFAVLIGTAQDGVAHVRQLEFGRNVRAVDPVALEEFYDTIIPRYGAAYEDPARGYWIDSADMLRIDRLARQLDLDILGSIHLHPDWHRLGPATARRMPLSERPTPMDDHVFRNTRWPVNAICYLEEVDRSMYYTLQAWGAAEAEGEPSRPLSTRVYAKADQPTAGVR